MATTETTCAYPPCEREPRARGWCRGHYLQWYRGAELSSLRGRRGSCRVQGCDELTCGRGYCNRHYRQWQNVPRIAKVRRWCSVDGCDRLSVGHTFCPMHFQRWKKHGDVHKVMLAMGSGDDITNSAAHSRVKALHGLASTHQCIDCGGRAAHWSYDHGDPNEKQSEDGPYSVNPEHYDPRCVPCHKVFDLAYIASGHQPPVKA